MEFKVVTNKSVANLATVLIESDWNLKKISLTVFLAADSVLIESDWNLKVTRRQCLKVRKSVLIESDWNLKYYERNILYFLDYSINRIRLEFKVHMD